MSTRESNQWMQKHYIQLLDNMRKKTIIVQNSRTTKLNYTDDKSLRRTNAVIRS